MAGAQTDVVRFMLRRHIKFELVFHFQEFIGDQMGEKPQVVALDDRRLSEILNGTGVAKSVSVSRVSLTEDGRVSIIAAMRNPSLARGACVCSLLQSTHLTQQPHTPLDTHKLTSPHLGVFECTLAVSLIDACVEDWESGKKDTSPICITRAVSIFERWGSILEPADWEVLGSKMLPLLDHPSNGICEAALRFCEAALPTHIQHYTVIPLYRVPTTLPPLSTPNTTPTPMLM